MAYTEFYVQPTGSNLNAGSTTADAAAFTYTSSVVASGWNAATGVFTVATGNPSSAGVTAGMYASIYVTSGATVATFVARITAVSSTTFTVSLAAVAGSPPATDSLGATTAKIGGAWAGMSGAVGFPFNFAVGALVDSSTDTVRVNIKNGTTYAITAAISHTLNGLIKFEGYTSAVGDGGRIIIDGGSSNITLLSVSGNFVTISGFIFQNNATGVGRGLFITGNRIMVHRCVAHALRGSGFYSQSGNDHFYIECEAYDCNKDNSSQSPFRADVGACIYIRCISHDTTTAVQAGFFVDNTARFFYCISANNNGDGFYCGDGSSFQMVGCDAYKNANHGLNINAANQRVITIENCNFVLNGTAGTKYGINVASPRLNIGVLSNCGFVDNRTAAVVPNLSLTESGTVTYTTATTPWVDPINGDFRISASAAKGAGRGSFTETATSYTGAVGYPDIGAAQHIDSGGSGGGGGTFISRQAINRAGMY